FRSDGWFLLPLPVEGVREAIARVSVPVTANLSVAITGEPSLPSRDDVVRRMVDPDGPYGMPRDVAERILFHGDVDDIAARLHAYGDAGADRIVVTLVAGD